MHTRARASGICAGRFGRQRLANTGDVPGDFSPVGGLRGGGGDDTEELSSEVSPWVARSNLIQLS